MTAGHPRGGPKTPPSNLFVSIRDYWLAFCLTSSDEYPCMKHADKYERLAQLTGFPNLANVNDPERLERLVTAAESGLAQCTLQCPLRYKLALSPVQRGGPIQARTSRGASVVPQVLGPMAVRYLQESPAARTWANCGASWATPINGPTSSFKPPASFRWQSLRSSFRPPRAMPTSPTDPASVGRLHQCT